MKLAYATIGYFTGAAVLIASGIGVGALFLGPNTVPSARMTADAVTAEPGKAAPAETTAAAPSGDEDPNRAPVWIAPTPTYPEVAPNNAEQAKKLTRSKNAESRRADWRLRERQRSFEGFDGALGFAGDPRLQQRRSSYQEPIQYREKTEPR